MRAVAKLRIGRSLWLNRVSGGLGRVRPALRGELGADVAVVGAGITGASVAWRFADAGLRVALVEAARVGRGSTAASTALLMQEPDKDLHERVMTPEFGPIPIYLIRRKTTLMPHGAGPFIDTVKAVMGRKRPGARPGPSKK